jgi:hypothetical protein
MILKIRENTIELWICVGANQFSNGDRTENSQLCNADLNASAPAVSQPVSGALHVR